MLLIGWNHCETRVPFNDFVWSSAYIVEFAAPGADSRAFIKNEVFVLLLYMVIRKPPPKPVKSGHTTLSHINVAMAASTELPPFCKTSLVNSNKTRKIKVIRYIGDGVWI